MDDDGQRLRRFTTATAAEGDAAAKLHMLVGVWHGQGLADFPTIQRVGYQEELRVDWDSDRNALCYEQRVVLKDGTPSHREAGYIRVLPDGCVQLWNAQDNGRTEVLRGSIEWIEADGQLRIELRSVEFGNDPRMLRSKRVIWIGSGRMRYEVSMSTTTVSGEELRPHLSAELASEGVRSEGRTGSL